MKTLVGQDKNRKVDEVSVREEKERKEYKEKQGGKADRDSKTWLKTIDFDNVNLYDDPVDPSNLDNHDCSNDPTILTSVMVLKTLTKEKKKHEQIR